MTLRTTEEELRELGLLDMLDSGGVSDEELEALVHQRRAERAAPPAELIAASPSVPGDWSPHDPGAMDRYIHACIKASRDKMAEPFEAGRLACGCPPDVAASYRADPRFTTRFQQLTHETIYLANLPAAMEAAMQDGGAYGVAQMRQAAPKDDLTDDEKRRAAAFSAMGPAELLREIERREKILSGFRERLQAGRSPPPERLARVQQEVVSVMDPPRRGPSASAQ